ncbi:Ras-related protein Rab-3 [Gryllus bimaculatus]|nr:Ras-related protein Rab-3 [Gryllus bimaculatus]
MAHYPQSDYVFKVVMVGDHHVGKSCLAHRFAAGAFLEGNVSTVGAAFSSRILEIEGKVVKVQIWDTAGQEQFRAMVPLYYRMANGVVVVYDTTDASSFRSVRDWVKDSYRYAQEGVELVVLGNKCDCADDRQVKYLEGERLAQSAGLPFYETSAKEGTNVTCAFVDLISAIKHRADLIENELRPFAENADEVKFFADAVRPCC